MAGISSVTATISTEFKWSVGNNLTGSVYTQTQNSGDIRKNYNFGTAASNAASGGGDEVFSFQIPIVGGGSATVDLTAMTNLLQQASVSIARIKGFQVRLLNTTDDSTITSPASTAILVTNNGVTLPCELDFLSGGTGLFLTLVVTTGVITSIGIAVGGAGYQPSATFLVAPLQTSASGGIIAVTTNSAGVVQSGIVVAGGAGYTSATADTVVVGHHYVGGGGASMYFDVSANGFCGVSSIRKNVKIYNLDPINVATVEWDVLAATT